MAERSVRRREEETRTPVAIVPSRRVVDERQIGELRSGLQRVRSEIAALAEYSRGIRVPASGRNAREIDSECQRMEQAVQRMRLSSVPILGERYRNELDAITVTITSARRAGNEGRIGEATDKLQRAGAQISSV